MPWWPAASQPSLLRALQQDTKPGDETPKSTDIPVQRELPQLELRLQEREQNREEVFSAEFVTEPEEKDNELFSGLFKLPTWRKT